MGRKKKDAEGITYSDSVRCMNLPRAVYHQCIWTVKDIDRLRMLEAIHYYREQPDEIMFCTVEGCSMVTDSVIEEGMRRLKAVRAALEPIPEDMREELIENIRAGTVFGDYAHENTWKKWKKRFVCELAHNLDLI